MSTETFNPFCRLDQTDARDLEGGRIIQRRDFLEADLLDGHRITLAPGHTGDVVLRIHGPEQRMVVSLPAEIALRFGSHAAALGAASLEPAEPEAAA